MRTFLPGRRSCSDEDLNGDVIEDVEMGDTD
jgi:hypothetical protein